MDVNNKIHAWKVAHELDRQSNDALNNILFDLREKYKVSDEDWIRMNTCISLITSRQIRSSLGVQ